MAAASSRFRRVLVVYKASALERYRDDGAVFDESRSDDPDVQVVLDKLQTAHQEHEASVAEVEEMLRGRGLSVMRAYHPRKSQVAKSDLVISVGGDGTFLWTARKVEGVPILGVNSAPGSSIGHYCGCHISSLEDTLERVLGGAIEPTPMPRLACWIRGQKMPYAALNDIFFAHRSPAASTRYLMRIGEDAEFQLSSGIWFSTQSGSTGAIRSAGGDAMPFGDGRIQYRVCAPYLRPGQELDLTAGYIDKEVKLVSRSPHNAVYLDGASLTHRVGFANTVVIQIAQEPLMVYGYGAAQATR